MAQALERDIREGRLSPGTKLPPQRELADYLDLNFTTITRAFGLCKEKGLIYGVTGRGTFVSPHAAELVTLHEKAGRERFIEMGYIGAMEWATPALTGAIRRAAQKDYLLDLLDYSHWREHPHHIAAARRWLEQFGIRAGEEHIAIVPGATGGLSIVLAALFRPGDTIAVDFYTFSNFIELARIFHIRLLPVPCDGEGMLAGELDRLCAMNAVQGIYLMPNCCNPTTVCISAQRRRELCHVIRKHHLTVIEDDWHMDLPSPERPSFYTLLPEQTCHLCGISKALSAGLRISFLVYGEAHRAQLTNAVYTMVMKTSALDMEAVAELILSGDAYKLIHQKRKLAQEANQVFDSIFPGCGPGGSSFFRWLPFHSVKPGKQAEAELLARGVELYHSYRFTVAPEEGDHYLRVALFTAGSMEKMKRGLEIIRAYYGEEGLWPEEYSQSPVSER